MAAVPKSGEPSYRRMQESDLEEVFRIEQAAYEFGWSQNIFRDCLRVGYHCLLQELDARIIGYAILSSAVAEAHLLNLCIEPPYQRRGMARQLLEKTLVLAEDTGAEDLFLEVRPSNLPARRLYMSTGFVEVAIRPGYYPAPKGREDAVVMARSLREFSL